MKRQVASACVLAAMFMLSGCGGNSGPKVPEFKGDTVPVSGTVTLDGEPLADAAVTFNFDGTPPAGFISAGGKTDSSGKYVVRAIGGNAGAPPGRYRVSISCMAMKDGSTFREDPEKGMDAEQMKMSGLLKEKIPAKYSDPVKSQLTIEITADHKDPANFALKSK